MREIRQRITVTSAISGAFKKMKNVFIMRHIDGAASPPAGVYAAAVFNRDARGELSAR
jgi:hypothetical protein